MFILGHSVVGSRLVGWLQRSLPLRWLVVGALLPDLIDKPLYYALVFSTGKRGAALGLVSGTRTFGHTGLFLIALSLVAIARRSPTWKAVAWGVGSHLFLDTLGDLFGLLSARSDSPTVLHAVFFPLLGAHFPISPFKSVREHALSIGNWYVLSGEGLGALLLGVSLWRRRRRARS